MHDDNYNIADSVEMLEDTWLPSPMILILMLTSIMIIFSTYLLKVLNETIIKILQKIFGIILGALSVEFIINGIKGVV